MSPTLEVLRVRYRAGELQPLMLLPGVPVEVRLPLPVTANRFRRGHRIRDPRHEQLLPAFRSKSEHRARGER